jgi:hypothetical protein
MRYIAIFLFGFFGMAILDTISRWWQWQNRNKRLL